MQWPKEKRQKERSSTKGTVIYKRNGHLQNTTQKTKDRATRTSLKPGLNLSVMNVLTVRPLVLVARYNPTRNNNGHLYVLFNVG